MTIQEYSEIIAMVSKIETRKAELAAAKNEFYAVNANEDPDTWLEMYDRTRKLEKSLKRMYKDFRGKIREDYSSLACGFCSDDNSDRNFYWCVRYNIKREAQNIEFTTGK